MAQSKKISEYEFPTELFVVGNKYSRDDINQRLDKGRIDGFKGITEFSNCFALVVTLEKKISPKTKSIKISLKTKENFSGKVNNQESIVENGYGIIYKEYSEQCKWAKDY